MSNFSAGHESRTIWTGVSRFAYPTRHIEADNRLSWLLGRLDAAYGDTAYYIHLTRDREDTAQSFLKRYDKGIMDAYHRTILSGSRTRNKETPPIEFCRDYYDTVNGNISLFLRDKTHKMNMQLENIREQWPQFWGWIGAEGDFSSALREWDVRHNESAPQP